MPVKELIKHWSSPHGWDIDSIRLLEQKQVVGLTAEIVKRGMPGEIILGSDGKVWDGLHRIAIALELNIHEIAFVYKDHSSDLIKIVRKYEKK